MWYNSLFTLFFTVGQTFLFSLLGLISGVNHMTHERSVDERDIFSPLFVARGTLSGGNVAPLSPGHKEDSGPADWPHSSPVQVSATYGCLLPLQTQQRGGVIVQTPDSDWILKGGRM